MRRLTRLAAVFAATTAGCGLFSDPRDELDDDLRRAEARWRAAGVQDYQVVVQTLCFCGYTRPARITVRSDSVVSRVDVETGEPVPSYAENVRDIPGLFALIRDAIGRNVFRLGVQYDAQYGYPVHIDIDYIGNAVDDELTVAVSDFQPGG